MEAKTETSLTGSRLPGTACVCTSPMLREWSVPVTTRIFLYITYTTYHITTTLYILFYTHSYVHIYIYIYSWVWSSSPSSTFSFHSLFLPHFIYTIFFVSSFVTSLDVYIATTFDAFSYFAARSQVVSRKFIAGTAFEVAGLVHGKIRDARRRQALTASQFSALSLSLPFNSLWSFNSIWRTLETTLITLSHYLLYVYTYVHKPLYNGYILYILLYTYM